MSDDGTRAKLLSNRTVSPEGCWEWTRATSHGYGRVWIGRKGYQVHRLAYTVFVGPIPDGLEVDHLCRNRRCFNPEHLEPVTRRENLRRGVGAEVTRQRWALITHCPQGHAYDEANTEHRPNRGRRCRTCSRAQTQAARKRKR